MVLLLLATLLNVSQANNQTKPQLDGLRYFNANQRDDIEIPAANGKLVIGSSYELTAFGLGICSAEFVLTTNNETGANCDEFQHTQSLEVKNLDYSDCTESNDIGKIILNTKELTLQAETYYFCLRRKGSDDDWIHAGNNPLQQITFAQNERQTILPVSIQVCVIALLLCLSGTFSGLNLGLMALDPQQLKILIDAGDDDEKKYAKKLLPVRRRGNFLLCTLLLGNVLVNNSLTIFLDDLTSGTVAIIGATAGIVVFGEIIPQAICSRHGLMIGYRTLPLTYIFMGVTGILSFPLGKLLDYILGDEVGMNYNRDRLIGLIREAENDLDEDEKQMIEGALKLNEKCVKEVMTHINYVFTVSEDEVVDYDFMQRITEAGYSRIPVTKSSTSGNGDITGLLFLRDLVMVDPDDRIEVSTVTKYYNHQLKDIDENTKLDDMLDNFKRGSYHLSLVTKNVVTDESGGESKEVCGIITLEDIIEEIICDEIVDETDKYKDNTGRVKNLKREKTMHPEFVDNMKKCVNPKDKVNPNNPDNLDEISKSEIAAVHRFLVAEVRPFNQDVIAESQLRMLLGRPENIVYVKRTDTLAPLIERGKPMSSFILVIEGKAEMTFGPDEIPIEVGSFRTFGIAVLNDIKSSKDAKKTNHGSQANIPIEPTPVAARLNDEWRAGSCPPGSSVPVTPVTTPTSGASVIPATGGTLAEFTVRIVSDSFVYLRVTRADYRQLRNHFEMRKAQEAEKVNSADNINQEPAQQQQATKTENGQVGNDQDSEKSRLLDTDETRT